MDPHLLTAEAELSDLERRAQRVAADLEAVRPDIGERVCQLVTLTRSLRLDLSRELRRAARGVAAYA